MVLIRNDKIFAKIWKIDKKEKYADLRISTSEKIEKDGNTTYENSNGFAMVKKEAYSSLLLWNLSQRKIHSLLRITQATRRKIFHFKQSWAV